MATRITAVRVAITQSAPERFSNRARGSGMLAGAMPAEAMVEGAMVEGPRIMGPHLRMSVSHGVSLRYGPWEVGGTGLAPGGEAPR